MIIKTPIKIPSKEQLGHGNIIKSKSNNVTYLLWEYGKIYNKEKQYNEKKRYTIGKVVSKDMFIPNDNFQSLFPNLISLENKIDNLNNILHFGIYLVIASICKKLNIREFLTKTFSEKNANFILDFATFLVSNNSLGSSTYSTYAIEHALFSYQQYIPKDSEVSNFFEEINSSKQDEFIQIWNLARTNKKEAYIFYNLTNDQNLAKDFNLIDDDTTITLGTTYHKAIGYNANEDRIILYQDSNNSPGDYSFLELFIDKLNKFNYNKFSVILESGYFTKKYIKNLTEKNIDFILMLKGKNPLVKSLIKQHSDTIKLSANCIISEYNVLGTTIKQKLYEDDIKERYFHLYYSPEINSEEYTKLTKTLQKHKDSLNLKLYTQYTPTEEINKYLKCQFDDDNLLVSYELNGEFLTDEMSYIGFFVLITSQEMTAQEAISTYQKQDNNKDISFFATPQYSTQCNIDKANHSIQAKNVIEFIALILRHEIYTSLLKEKLSKGRKFSYLNVPNAIKDLDAIKLELWKDKQYNLSKKLTDNQKNILAAFSITEQDLQEEINCFNKEIFNAN